MYAMQDEGGASLTPADADTDAPAAVDTAGRSRLYAVVFAVALLMLVLDQGTKMWALSSLVPGAPRDLFGSLLRLELIRNPGAAFSIATNATWLLVGVAVLAWVATAIRRIGSLAWALALGLLLGGALGNLVDRFFRAPGPGRGQVVDFIDYAGLFIGNVADIAIVVAAAIIVVLALRGVTIAGERVRPEQGRHTDAGRTTVERDARRGDEPDE
jgi:signal peptidase II